MRASSYGGYELKSEPKKLLARHQQLVHSDMRKVVSHVQRAAGEWIINTVMIDGQDVPFRYMRKNQYKSLTGASVNLTYYPTTESVAGVDVEVMKVVRIRRS
jgi:hypothetical protein